MNTLTVLDAASAGVSPQVLHPSNRKQLIIMNAHLGTEEMNLASLTLPNGLTLAADSLFIAVVNGTSLHLIPREGVHHQALKGRGGNNITTGENKVAHAFAYKDANDNPIIFSALVITPLQGANIPGRIEWSLGDTFGWTQDQMLAAQQNNQQAPNFGAVARPAASGIPGVFRPAATTPVAQPPVQAMVPAAPARPAFIPSAAIPQNGATPAPVASPAQRPASIPAGHELVRPPSWWDAEKYGTLQDLVDALNKRDALALGKRELSAGPTPTPAATVVEQVAEASAITETETSPFEEEETSVDKLV